MGFSGGSGVKNPSRDMGLIPGSGRFPQRKKRQPTPVFLPGKSHGQRNLVGYSPWGCKRVGHDLATKYTHSDSHMLVSNHSGRVCVSFTQLTLVVNLIKP